jgi:hypothetical protein
MAAANSRELGVKVLAGQQRLAHLGFRAVGIAAFGLRRMMYARRAKKTCAARPRAKGNPYGSNNSRAGAKEGSGMYSHDVRVLQPPGRH